jgi:IclR family acetate operon transcriptional repressor
MGVKASGSATTTLRALEAVARQQPLGVTGVSQALGVTKSAAQRALATLAAAGWIRPDAVEAGRWELTPRAWVVGRAFLDRHDLRSAVLPLMADVRDRTGETVHLSVRDAAQAVIVEALESQQPVRAGARIGMSSSVVRSAGGQAMIAFTDADEVAELVATHPEVEEVVRSLPAIRARGYALNLGRVNPDVHSVAVPVTGPNGHAIGAIVVTAPKARMPRARAEAHGKLLVAVVGSVGAVGLRSGAALG